MSWSTGSSLAAVLMISLASCSIEEPDDLLDEERGGDIVDPLTTDYGDVVVTSTWAVESGNPVAVVRSADDGAVVMTAEWHVADGLLSWEIAGVSSGSEPLVAEDEPALWHMNEIAILIWRQDVIYSGSGGGVCKCDGLACKLCYRGICVICDYTT